MDINPKPKCFNGLASELTDIDSEVAWSNFDVIEDEETAYQFLAEELLALNGRKFPLNEPYADTPMQHMHTMCVTLLNVYYPITEIALWMDDPEYEPTLYSPLNIPQAKLVMAIAKAMLEKSGPTAIYDSHIDDDHIRDWLHGKALGRTGHIGLHTMRSGRSGGRKGGVQSPEDIKEKKDFVIREYNKHIEKNTKNSIRSAAQKIFLDKAAWYDAGLINKIDDPSPWKLTSIRDCIANYLKTSKIVVK